MKSAAIRRSLIILIFLAVAVVVVVILDRMHPKLNLANPRAFMATHLPRALDEGGTGLRTDSISHEKWLVLVNGGETVGMWATLIDGTCTSDGYCYIHLNGRKMSHDEAVESARSILRMLKYNPAQLDKWVNERYTRKSATAVYEENLRTGQPISFSLAIRDSFDIDGSDPWMVHFSVHMKEAAE